MVSKLGWDVRAVVKLRHAMGQWWCNAAAYADMWYCVLQAGASLHPQCGRLTRIPRQPQAVPSLPVAGGPSSGALSSATARLERRTRRKKKTIEDTSTRAEMASTTCRHTDAAMRWRASGSRAGASVLNEGQVKEIEHLLLSGVSQPQIAKKFGVARTTVSSISIGKNWSWLHV